MASEQSKAMAPFRWPLPLCKIAFVKKNCKYSTETAGGASVEPVQIREPFQESESQG